MLQYKKFPQGCTIFDVVLQCYLSMNMLPKLIEDNSIKDVNLTTIANQEFVYDDDYIYDEFQSNDVIKNNYKLCTGDLKIFNNVVRGNYLLIENSEILKDEVNNLFTY